MKKSDVFAVRFREREDAKKSLDCKTTALVSLRTTSDLYDWVVAYRCTKIPFESFMQACRLFEVLGDKCLKEAVYSIASFFVEVGYLEKFEGASDFFTKKVGNTDQ